MYLTIDLDLETVAANSMKTRKFSGSVVALDPRSGEILALLNYPSYDPEIISGREVNRKVWDELRSNKDHPLINRAIQEHYPPGSTFKLFLAVAGLAEGAVNLKSTVSCAGSIFYGNRRWNCWKKHGVVDFTRAIKESCDVFFYKLGIQLGIDVIAKYARFFGLGSKTEVMLSNEQTGLIPDSQWKLARFQEPWYPGETPSVAIGQGFVSVTPLQLALAYGAIGNGGFVYRPFILKKIESRNGEMIKEKQPELVRKVEIPFEILEAVKEGLYRVVNESGGTGFLHKSKKVIISGKTGTSQVRAFSDISKIKHCDDLERDHKHHGWFVGYAPRENPEIVVAVVAEHACHGSSAAPVVRDVNEQYFSNRPVPAGGAPEEKTIVLKPALKPVPRPVGTEDEEALRDDATPSPNEEAGN
jgi:penicillin-binding protein 2